MVSEVSVPGQLVPSLYAWGEVKYHGGSESKFLTSWQIENRGPEKNPKRKGLEIRCSPQGHEPMICFLQPGLFLLHPSNAMK